MWSRTAARTAELQKVLSSLLACSAVSEVPQWGAFGVSASPPPLRVNADAFRQPLSRARAASWGRTSGSWAFLTGGEALCSPHLFAPLKMASFTQVHCKIRELQDGGGEPGDEGRRRGSGGSATSTVGQQGFRASGGGCVMLNEPWTRRPRLGWCSGVPTSGVESGKAAEEP